MLGKDGQFLNALFESLLSVGEENKQSFKAQAESANREYWEVVNTVLNGTDTPNGSKEEAEKLKQVLPKLKQKVEALLGESSVEKLLLERLQKLESIAYRFDLT
jgi:hypothetical protein